MVWRAEDPEGVESKKIVWEVAPYLRGRGLDLGAGVFKVLPHVISVDNGHHEAFGHSINPDIKIETAEKLDIFGSQSMDFVFSSHLLEHIVDYKSALKEWWRVLKKEGYLVLYLPHKDYYPNIGQYGANPDHKHDFVPKDILEAMDEVASGFDCLEVQERNDGMEYSMLLIFKKIHGSKNRYSYENERPAKTALVCRFGAFGDLMQASSVLAGLKEQGYHVTLMASQPGVAVVEYDPNIDEFMLLDKDQIPNANLVDFWRWQAKKYDKFVNLSESVEGTLLAMPTRAAHGWAPLVRHRHMNTNYLEFQHDLAGVPHKPNVKFYATLEEKQWAARTREKMGKLVIMWSLAGSSVHKTWAGLDSVMAMLLLTYPEVHIVLVGGPEAAILEGGWENERRVHRTCGKWQIRQTLAFLDQADIVIGPETGVMNAACCAPMRKIVFLSHSSHENLTRDWVNTTPLWSEGTRCWGRDSDAVTACHALHFGWDYCTKDAETGTAKCQKDILPDQVWSAVREAVEGVLSKQAGAA